MMSRPPDRAEMRAPVRSTSRTSGCSPASASRAARCVGVVAAAGQQQRRERPCCLVLGADPDGPIEEVGVHRVARRVDRATGGWRAAARRRASHTDAVRPWQSQPEPIVPRRRALQSPHLVDREPLPSTRTSQCARDRQRPSRGSRRAHGGGTPSSSLLEAVEVAAVRSAVASTSAGSASISSTRSGQCAPQRPVVHPPHLV